MMLAAGIMIAKPTAASSSPRVNLAGLDSSVPRRAMPTQSAAKIGAKMMMKSELIDWNQVAGTSKPNIVRSVKSFANRLSDVGACSNAPQNAAANTNSTKITAMRRFSSPVRLPVM